MSARVHLRRRSNPHGWIKWVLVLFLTLNLLLVGLIAHIMWQRQQDAREQVITGVLDYRRHACSQRYVVNSDAWKSCIAP